MDCAMIVYWFQVSYLRRGIHNLILCGDHHNFQDVEVFEYVELHLRRCIGIIHAFVWLDSLLYVGLLLRFIP